MIKKIFFVSLFSILFFILGESKAYAATFTSANVADYKKIVSTNTNNLVTDFTINYTGNLSELQKRISPINNEIINENPILNGVVKSRSIKQQYSGNKAVVTYKISYSINKNQYNQAINQANTISNKIALTNKTDFDKVKAVNDYIAKNTSYVQTKNGLEYNIYGSLINKKAVCQGYALAAYQLLKNLGVNVQYVTGYGNGLGHAWNKVRVNNKWYNLDVTWNDATPNKPYQTIYKYFLVSDNVFKRDHSWNVNNYQKSTDTSYDFFNKMNYATKIGNVFYYANNTDNSRLYKYDMSKKKNTKLSNSRPVYIQSYKNRLYFSDYANGGKLTSTDLNGKNVKIHNKIKTDYLNVDSGFLHFVLNGKWNKIKL